MPQWAVQAPDGKVIQFPDSFTEQDVTREMYKMYSTPPGVPNPRQQLNMQEWGGTPSPTAGLPGGTPNPQPYSAGPGYTAAVAGPLAIAGAAAVAPAGTASALGRAAWWAAKRGAVSAAINQARKIPVVGPYIPSGMELAPFFYGGGGAAEAAKVTGGTAAAGEAESALATLLKKGESIPVKGTTETAAMPSASTSAGRISAVPAAESYAPVQNAPYTFSGESALRQVLTGQDNQALLKIARSRGVDVTKEALLKPGKADNQIINKIVDSMSPEELDEIQAKYLENTRMSNNMGDIGPEAWKTLSLQTYFPDLKLPQARLARTTKAIQANRPQNLYELLNQ